MTTELASAIDVRTIAPRDRHPFIFGRFDRLRPGEALLLVNDHDPRPLYHQFEQRCGGQFDWTYLRSGPDLWKVQIGKKHQGTIDAFAGSCCSGGACGG
ncbi:DUF2249 domain-containing protein [Comamonadaceae bacterium G21597-S1]|nr:DUF2249 domain-containing protein [Comamonadaceae bacterium G21597-S1]